MKRIFVTGSADGLGLMSARLLAEEGHRVTLHARSERRAADALRELPTAEGVVVGDVTTLAGMRAVAERANVAGAFDAVIHNVAIGYQQPSRAETEDGIEEVFAVNVLAPYVLTAAMLRPKRLIYLSSGMHRDATPNLDDPQWKTRRWNGPRAYADSKLLDVVIAFAVARRWPAVRTNALEPGWVATRMGGPHAPDDLALGPVTQAWLAASEEPAATTTAGYFFHQEPCAAHPATRDVAFQDALLAYCARLSGIELAEA